MLIAVDAVNVAPGGGLTYLREQMQAITDSGMSAIIFTGTRAYNQLVDLLPGLSLVPSPKWAQFPLFKELYRQVVVPRRAAQAGAAVLYCPGSVGVIHSSLPSIICIQNPHLFCEQPPRGKRFAALRLALWLTSLRANHIIHISNSMMADFQTYSQLDLPSGVIYSGVPNLASSERGHLTAASPPHQVDGFQYIFMANNLYRYKRVDTAISALALVKPYQDLHLVVAGTDPDPFSRERTRLVALAIDLNVEREVHFIGFISGHELASLYRGAAAYVSASEREAFPLTPAEAISTGARTILSNIKCHLEIYSDWAEFFVVGDSQSLAERLLTAPLRRHSEMLEERYTWSAHANALRDVFATVAQEPPVRYRHGVRRWRSPRPWDLLRTIIGSATAAP